MTGVLIGFAIVGIVIAAGYVTGRIGIAGPHAQFVLNRMAFFVLTPALLFSTLAEVDLRDVFSAALVVAAVGAVAAMAIYVAISSIFLRRSVAETVIGALSSSYVNANNIGLPVAVFVLGSSSFVVPVLLIQLVIFAPVALTVLDIATNAGSSRWRILTLPVRNPMIIASVAGIVLAALGIRLPEQVMAPFVLVGGAAVPVVLLAFGMSLVGLRPLKVPGHRRDVIIAVAIKALVMPLIAFIVARFALGMSGHQLFAVVTLAALPVAQNVFNYASRYERGVAVARDAVLVSTIVAIPVIVGIAALLA